MFAFSVVAAKIAYLYQDLREIDKNDFWDAEAIAETVTRPTHVWL